MGLRCMFGFHRPTLGEVEEDHQGYLSVCRFCSQNIRRLRLRKWVLDKRVRKGS